MSQLTCDMCGKQDETVEETICPYAWEIDEEVIEMTLCEDCHGLRSEEI